MESLFTHPLTMAAGAALVSAPIIIHLINRMRFRRVKWAAMEFLLKAQKRMRRKLILEQLLLLLLRCLLVFLAGVLLARFLGFGTGEREDARATAHAVVFDDSPSMGEAVLVEGRQTTPFAEARTQITDKIAPAAAQANTPQSMDVLLLSALDTPRAVDRLNDSSISDLKDFLRPLQPAAVRVGLADGLRKAKDRLDAKGDEVAKVIHVVSDLRALDWAEDGDAVKQLLTEYTAAGIRVNLIDMAYPARRDQDRQPRSGDNLGIVEFRPRSRVAAKFQPVDFELRVKNNGATEARDVQVRFLLHGKQNLIPSVSVPSVPPYQERTTVVTVPGFDIGDEEAKDPVKRFKVVTAVLATAEPGGIAADNTRHAVVEVRPRLSVLVVEGREQLRDSPKGDGYYLRRLFQDAYGGIEWVDGTPADLDRRDLRPFSAVYLLNVPAVTESQREKLEAYVKGGGGLAFFLGPDVRPAAYRDQLYRNGAGVFPVPLPDEPSKPLTDEQKLRRALVLSKRVLTRDPGVKQHPAVAGMYAGERGAAAKDVEIERYFLFANIDRYWPVKRFGKWREDQSVRELYCLPNDQSVAEFEGPVRDALDKMKAKANEPKFEKYRQYLDPLDRKIRETAAGSAPLSSLATYLDRLVCDQINDGDPSEPVLREFWGQPELADLKPEFQRLRDAVKFGDPLYLVKEFGRGRVAVFTTDAGGAYPSGPWTDWPAGTGAPAWLAVVAELHKYLSGGPTEENRSVGSVIDETLDPARYRPAVSRVVLTCDPGKGDRGGDAEVTVSKVETDTMSQTAGALAFRFGKTTEPGVYLFTLTALSGPNNDIERPEVRAYPFNVDAAREGDLRRAARDDLAQQAPNVPVRSPEDTSWVNALKQKRDDFSTRRWLYLFILLVLIAEQAMAVRLSRHTRAEDVELHAPSAAAAFARGSAPAAAAAPAAEPAGVCRRPSPGALSVAPRALP
ncbi:MAG TPA: BatA domain-containing protein, partial [Urbifossiella sp.]|nr:BatA domain-containing protein [Urbifossiella sp.]